MKWHKSPIEKNVLTSLIQRFDFSPLTAAVLARRGLSEPEEVQFFIEKRVQHSHNPFLLESMDDAVDRINRALEDGERIFVYGDRDVDGITSIASMVSWLLSKGAEVHWALPMGDDSYGLTPEVIEKLGREGAELLITVDCGVTNGPEIAQAQELGIDTVVIDHHNPPETLPEPVAMVNPKTSPNYPFDGLCAAQLVAKTIWALEFSQTELYGQRHCLLHCELEKDSMVLHGWEMQNMVCMQKLSLGFPNDISDIENHPLLRLITSGIPLMVFDEQGERSRLQQIFGPSAQIGLSPLAPQFYKRVPAMAGMSLGTIGSKARFVRYQKALASPMDILYRVFIDHCNDLASTPFQVYENYLELAALGIVSDMMPVLNENRILLERGLQRLSSGSRFPGLQGLLVKQNLVGKELSSKDLGWKIGPLINSTGRMGQPDIGVKLLLSQSSEEARQLIDQVVALNSTRKKAGDQGWKQVQTDAIVSLEQSDHRLIAVYGPSIERGVTGIIAGRLSREHQVPALVMTDCDGVTIGSVRGVRGFRVTQWLDGLAKYLERYGGHDAAGGFTVKTGHSSDFLTAAQESARDINLDSDTSDTLSIDAFVPPSHMGTSLGECHRIFSVSGQGFGPVVYAAGPCTVADAQIVGKSGSGHLKLLLAYGEGRWPAMMWNGADLINTAFKVGEQIEILFNYEINEFRGVRQPQLNLLDLRSYKARDEG